jgi:nucleoside-diphosphate-sugar epimerase
LSAADVVFNLAGEISHARSMRAPLRDLELNTVAQLRFLQTLARVRPGIRVVYAGTRQVYGQATRLPVDEDHAIQPTDYNGAHKRAAELYHQMLSDKGRLDAVVLRLTNTYGPRLSMKAEGQGFLSVFLRRALEGKPIEVFGDGSQLRDPVYVDDVVDAFVLGGTVERPAHRVFNVGATTALTLNEIARIMTAAGGGDSEPVLRPFPEEHKAVDIGSYVADTRRIQAELGWTPKVEFDAGVRKTLDWLREQALQR